MEIIFCISWILSFIMSTFVTLWGVRDKNPNVIRNSVYFWLANIALGWILGYMIIITLGFMALDSILNEQKVKNSVIEKNN